MNETNISQNTYHNIKFHYGPSIPGPEFWHIPVNEMFNSAFNSVPSILQAGNNYEISVKDIIQKKYKNICSKETRVSKEELGSEYLDNDFLFEVSQGLYLLLKERFFPKMNDWLYKKNNNKIKNIQGYSLVTFFHLKNENTLNEIESILKDLEIHEIYAKKSKKSYINLMKTDFKSHVSLDVDNPKIDLKLNYGEILSTLHKKILQRLSKPKDKGIIILDGPPGTGKTTYIRKLLYDLKNKKPIWFLPKHMAEMIGTGEFISYMLSKPNSILIIEDGEKIVQSRENINTTSEALTNLLSLSDGLLADSLGIQIICTFNTKITNVDTAFFTEQVEMKQKVANTVTIIVPNLEKKSINFFICFYLNFIS